MFSTDGWVYTNDAWLGPRLVPYTSGGGSVTCRRRWAKRFMRRGIKGLVDVVAADVSFKLYSCISRLLFNYLGRKASHENHVFRHH